MPKIRYPRHTKPKQPAKQPAVKSKPSVSDKSELHSKDTLYIVPSNLHPTGLLDGSGQPILKVINPPNPPSGPLLLPTLGPVSQPLDNQNSLSSVAEIANIQARAMGMSPEAREKYVQASVQAHTQNLNNNVLEAVNKNHTLTKNNLEIKAETFEKLKSFAHNNQHLSKEEIAQIFSEVDENLVYIAWDNKQYASKPVVDPFSNPDHGQKKPSSPFKDQLDITREELEALKGTADAAKEAVGAIIDLARGGVNSIKNVANNCRKKIEDALKDPMAENKTPNKVPDNSDDTEG